MNSHAVKPLTNTPASATTITVVPCTASGFGRRRTASQPRPPVTSTSAPAFSSAARMELPRNPYVKRSLGGRRASPAATQASNRDSTSPRLCTASANNASEWAVAPNTHSAMTKATFNTKPTANALPNEAGACTWPTWW